MHLLKPYVYSRLLKGQYAVSIFTLCNRVMNHFNDFPNPFIQLVYFMTHLFRNQKTIYFMVPAESFMMRYSFL